jgi:outer membrane protein
MTHMTRQIVTCALIAAAALAGAPSAEPGPQDRLRKLRPAPGGVAAGQGRPGVARSRVHAAPARRRGAEIAQEKSDKLQKEAAVMSEAIARTEREVRDLELNVNRRFKELQEDLNLRRNEEVGKMQRAAAGSPGHAKTNGTS